MVTTPCQPEQPRRHHGNKRLLHTKELTPLQVTSAHEKVSSMRLLIILRLAQNITFNLEEFHLKEHIIFLATSFRLVYLTIVPERWALLVSHDVSAPFPSTCHLIVYGFSTSPNLSITKEPKDAPYADSPDVLCFTHDRQTTPTAYTCERCLPLWHCCLSRLGIELRTLSPLIQCTKKEATGKV